MPAEAIQRRNAAQANRHPSIDSADWRSARRDLIPTPQCGQTGWSLSFANTDAEVWRYSEDSDLPALYTISLHRIPIRDMIPLRGKRVTHEHPQLRQSVWLRANPTTAAGCGSSFARIIAVVGIVSYFSHTQVNPVTGEKQHISLSVDQEKTLGLQAAPQMASQMGGGSQISSDLARDGAGDRREIVAKSEFGKQPVSGQLQISPVERSANDQCLRAARRAGVHHARAL